MKDQIGKALLMMRNFSNFEDMDVAIPPELLQQCHGLAFISMVKVGVVYSGSVGTGCVIARLGPDKWSGPLEINSISAGLGWQWGAQKADSIILLDSPNAVKAFTGAQLKLGTDMAVTIGPGGRQISVDARVGKKLTSCFSYSTCSGLYMGMSLEGGIVKVNPRATKKFYGTKVKPADVMSGDVKPPPNKVLEALQKLLVKASSKEAVEEWNNYLEQRRPQYARHQEPMPQAVAAPIPIAKAVESPAAPAPVAAPVAAPAAAPQADILDLSALMSALPDDVSSGVKKYDADLSEGDKIAKWLTTVAPNLEVYGPAFLERYGTMQALRSASPSDFQAAMEEGKVKKPHQKLLADAHVKCEQDEVIMWLDTIVEGYPELKATLAQNFGSMLNIAHMTNEEFLEEALRFAPNMTEERKKQVVQAHLQIVSAELIIWLESTAPGFKDAYSAFFIERFGSLNALAGTSIEDFATALDECAGMKKPHKSVLKKAHGKICSFVAYDDDPFADLLE